MKEIQEELNKWRDIPCPWTGIFNIVKMPVLPNLINRLKAIPVKTAANYFVDINNLVLNFT